MTAKDQGMKGAAVKATANAYIKAMLYWVNKLDGVAPLVGENIF